LPPPIGKEENEKHEWKLTEIKEFVELAGNYRDKALILCLFQSGQGINEIVQLNYGHIKDELETGIMPLCLKLIRQKTQQEGNKYRTFFGRDAMKYLKLYLETRHNLKNNSPLFTMLGTEKQITGGAIEKRFRELEKLVSFTHREKTDPKSKDYNSLRPHSLRGAFRSALTGKMDRDLIIYMMGQALSSEKHAYINLPTDELRELYANHEKYVAIEKTSKDELAQITTEGKMTEDYKERIRRMESVITDISSELQKTRTELDESITKQEMFEDAWEMALEELSKRVQKEMNDKKEG